MTQGLEKALNLPSLEEALAETVDTTATNDLVSLIDAAEKKIDMVTGTDHARDTDDIYEQVLKHAENVMEYGFNIDHARAAAFFEQGNALYKTALDAKNAKRDAELKVMRLQLEREKLELMKEKLKGDQPQQQVIEAEGVMIVDRNELLKQLRKKD